MLKKKKCRLIFWDGTKKMVLSYNPYHQKEGGLAITVFPFGDTRGTIFPDADNAVEIRDRYRWTGKVTIEDVE